MNLIKPVSRQGQRASASEIAPTLAKRFEEPRPAAGSGAPMKKCERLFSLDFLRGADMLFLTVFSVILYAVHRHFPLPDWFMAQLRHPDWVGFTAYDMIMPLFIFMCGAALPLALPKYLDGDGRAGAGYWVHVLKRVALLWFLGLVAQGELFSYDLRTISFFNNTLQTIAVGYLATAVVSRIPSTAVQVAIPFALAAGYTAFLHLCGDMTPAGNAAVVYEVKFLGLFYPHASWHPVKQIADWHYTWWTTVPMFAAMGLAGYHATRILLVERWEKRRKASVQLAVGAGLVALGFALLTFDPCVKHIFTASFTALAMGASFILYSICYTVFDIRGWRPGTWAFTLFGRNALCAYLLADTCFQRILDSFPKCALSGLPDRVSNAQYGMLFVLLRCAFLVFILYVWDWHKRGKSAAAKAAREAREGK